MADYKAFSPTTWRAFTKKCSELFPFLKKTFTGTQVEWAALTTDEQNNYDVVNITDDEGVFVEGIDTTPTKDSSNLITSGGVYDVLHAKGLGSVVASSLTQGANTFGSTNITDVMGENFAGLLMVTDRRNAEIGALYLLILTGGIVSLHLITSNRATLSFNGGVFTYNDSAGLSSANIGKVTAIRLAYY